MFKKQRYTAQTMGNAQECKTRIAGKKKTVKECFLRPNPTLNHLHKIYPVIGEIDQILR